VSKRERVHLVHHSHLLLAHLDPLQQRPDDLPAGRQVGVRQAILDPTGEVVQPAEEFPQVGLRRPLVPPGRGVRLQPGEPFPGGPDPWLELALTQQPILVRVHQPIHPPAGGLDQTVG
jgi:hypothetical protein